MIKNMLKRLVPRKFWKLVRERKIIATHARVADICRSHVESYYLNHKGNSAVTAKVFFPEGTKLVWQYWAQGFDNVPQLVRECLDSVDRYCQDCTVIRLDDSNIDKYLDLPEYVLKKRKMFGFAFFSDLLRVMLLNTYGGIWMDATILLTAPLSESYFDVDFFAFQRDSNQQYKEYWENTYAYYFSWEKGFRVNMLSSFMSSKSGKEPINTLCGCMMEWWREKDFKPDYFFLQILFDVLIHGRLKEYNCVIESDCPPHYLQQFKNDPDFYIKSKDEIYRLVSIHKLTYK